MNTWSEMENIMKHLNICAWRGIEVRMDSKIGALNRMKLSVSLIDMAGQCTCGQVKALQANQNEMWTRRGSEVDESHTNPKLTHARYWKMKSAGKHMNTQQNSQQTVCVPQEIPHEIWRCMNTR